MELLESVLHKLEISLLRHQHIPAEEYTLNANDGNRCSDLLCFLQMGKYFDVLKHETAKKIFLQQSSDGTSGLHSADAIITNVEKFITESDTDCSESHKLVILCIAVACLHLFVQNNWLGPVTCVTDSNSDADINGYFKECVAASQTYLCVDGEAINEATINIVFLYLARVLLHGCHQLLKDCLSVDWWLLRVIRIHQDLLNERSATLKTSAMELIENVSKREQLMANDEYRDLVMQFHLEAGHICYFFYEPRQAKDHFSRAEKLSGLAINLTGLLGKRTRFQQKNISQLLLEVKRAEDSLEIWCPTEVPEKNCLPTNVSLDDDSVLEELQLLDGSDFCMEDISGAQQALVLGLCYRHRKSMEGQGKIVEEECMAYIRSVLHRPVSWAVQSTALLIRSRWEWDSARRMQRSMSQLEEIVRQFKQVEPGPAVRLPLVYTVQLPPIWEVKKQLASLFEKIGAMNAALEVYLSIESWSDVIKCYTALGNKKKAESLIRQQLAVKETPLLWCYLGDLYNDEEYYQKAWDLSKGRFGRAQRSLAYLYLHHKEYEKSLNYFEMSLKVNPLQIGVWFSYGCAALAAEKYDVAAKGFRRCVNLDSDNFEAWNNLATSYIRSKQKSRAFLALQEALKCEFENWKLWANYLLVAVDLGEFAETIRAYHRLLDLKDKYVDTEVLGILVKAFKDGLKDAHDQPVSSLKSKALELFGRTTSKVTTNADVWKLYADLVLATEGLEVSPTDREKALQHLQKSHRCRMQVSNWEKNVEKCKEMLSQSSFLAQAYIDCSSNTEEVTQSNQILASARLMIKGVLSKVKQQQTDLISGDLRVEVAPLYSELEAMLATITDLIQKQS